MEIQITEREIKALQKIVAKYENDEYLEACAEISKIGAVPEDWDDGSQTWYDIVAIQGLLLKLGKI